MGFKSFLIPFIFLALLYWLGPPQQCLIEVMSIAILTHSYLQRESFQHFIEYEFSLFYVDILFYMKEFFPYVLQFCFECLLWIDEEFYSVLFVFIKLFIITFLYSFSEWVAAIVINLVMLFITAWGVILTLGERVTFSQCHFVRFWHQGYIDLV